MFALIATVCLSADVSTCRPLLWEELFDSVEECEAIGQVMVKELSKDVFYVNGGCFVAKEKPNV